MATAIAAVAREARGDFTIEEINVAPPAAGEVHVRIAGVGLCHTDLVFRDQFDAFAKPAVLGHEGAGVVEAVGPDVDGIAVGDRVILGFSSCGGCPRCAEHLPSYCQNFVPLNYAGMRLNDGTSAYAGLDGARISSHFFGQSSFSTIAVARAGNVVKVPSDCALPLELLGPLGCGLMTGAGAVMKSMACKAGSSLIVFGGGPVGLAAVMAGKIQGCTSIILVEPVAARRAIALEIGATDAIDPAAGDIGQAIRALLPLGVDAALDTTGNIGVIETALANLAPHGVLGLVGVPKDIGASFSVNVAALMTPGLRILGIIEGDAVPQDFIPELLALQAQGHFPFDRLIRTFPLAEINAAVAAQAQGECIKVVLVP
ncbi:NAD(P)-dependent alcohol dehydrogenase [Novosphingobium cyanobacteriorum]|uniref:NAD(P)-dependent alcohol dehydrogenase n=1 Tax=Novosphingobium cyanobacteriorum TaxID=3024215 RepID=A0ABT6CJN0_9SPHN|nr:NAD(P)-dependent alcohol dehydrogenase [Novosphingobium cyanobacteriorum]MDF8333773.1 NAD(P)-dependent alcohol dehydrogenase [Novosphingobium cyanobacteriorum]